MPVQNSENNSLLYYTNSIANNIDPSFYRLRSSFKSLKIYELFLEILKCRGYEYTTDFNQDVHDEIKHAIIKQLEESANLTTNADSNIKEAFYLGMICNTIVHTNLPIPEEFNYFGNITISLEDIDR